MTETVINLRLTSNLISHCLIGLITSTFVFIASFQLYISSNSSISSLRHLVNSTKLQANFRARFSGNVMKNSTPSTSKDFQPDNERKDDFRNKYFGFKKLKDVTYSTFSNYADALWMYKRPNYVENLSLPCFVIKNDDQNKTLQSDSKNKWPVRNGIYPNNLHGINPLSANTLRCIPSIYIIGVSKAGTTDVYSHLLHHPHVIAGYFKEPHFWEGVRPFKRRNTFQYYLDSYDAIAGIIEKCYLNYNHVKCEMTFISKAERDRRLDQTVHMPTLGPLLQKHKLENKPCFLKTIDATTSYINTVEYWDRYSNYNLNNEDQNIFTPHMIRHFVPNPKIMIFLRHPIQRLISDFHFFLSAKFQSSESFHRLVENGIRWWKNCIAKLSEERCAFGVNYTGTGVPNLQSGLFKWGTSNSNGAARVRLSIYVVYIEKWLQIFDLHSEVYVQSLEEHKKRPIEVLTKEMLPFLELEPLNDNSLKKLYASILKGPKNKSREHKMAIWPKTLKLLQDFYAPYNKRLARLLDNTDYLWPNT